MRVPVYGSAGCLLLVVASVVGLPSTARAFGPAGHRLAADLAERHLCPQTRARLEPLLGGLSLATAGLWPDWIRAEPGWQHTRSWHYINVGDRASLARAARRDDDNVLAALARFDRELRDVRLPVAERALALRFLVHFLVDIHQPLHVGRPGDRGGNTVEVRIGGRVTSLHAVWDGELLLAAGGPDGPASRDRAGRFPEPGPRVLAAWQQGGPLDWAAESRALRPQVYGFPVPPAGPATLDAAYLDRARQILDVRLLQAGIRLARRLDDAMGVGPGCRAK